MSNAVCFPLFNAEDALLTRYLLATCKKNRENWERAAEQMILGKRAVEEWLESQGGEE